MKFAGFVPLSVHTQQMGLVWQGSVVQNPISNSRDVWGEPSYETLQFLTLAFVFFEGGKKVCLYCFNFWLYSLWMV